MSGKNSGAEKKSHEAAASHRPARDRIFETAKRMFYQRGIRAVGVDSIAAEADATKMTLYRNFPSKDELVAEILREQVKEYWEWWEEVFATCADNPRAKLEALFDAFSEKSCDDDYGCPLNNAAIELHEVDHPGRIVSVEHKREMHRRLNELARAAGAPDDDLGDALMLLMEGAYTARVTLGPDGPMRSVGRAARLLMQQHLDRAPA
jgi:AcrR family transcriptional regulator